MDFPSISEGIFSASWKSCQLPNQAFCTVYERQGKWLQGPLFYYGCSFSLSLLASPQTLRLSEHWGKTWLENLHSMLWTCDILCSCCSCRERREVGFIWIAYTCMSRWLNCYKGTLLCFQQSTQSYTELAAAGGLQLKWWQALMLLV